MKSSSKRSKLEHGQTWSKSVRRDPKDAGKFCRGLKGQDESADMGFGVGLVEILGSPLDGLRGVLALEGGGGNRFDEPFGHLDGLVPPGDPRCGGDALDLVDRFRAELGHGELDPGLFLCAFPKASIHGVQCLRCLEAILLQGEVDVDGGEVRDVVGLFLNNFRSGRLGGSGRVSPPG